MYCLNKDYKALILLRDDWWLTWFLFCFVFLNVMDGYWTNTPGSGFHKFLIPLLNTLRFILETECYFQKTELYPIIQIFYWKCSLIKLSICVFFSSCLQMFVEKHNSEFKSDHGNWTLIQYHWASIYLFVEKLSCLTIQLNSCNYVNNLQICNYNQSANALAQ